MPDPVDPNNNVTPPAPADPPADPPQDPPTDDLDLIPPTDETNIIDDPAPAPQDPPKPEDNKDEAPAWLTDLKNDIQQQFQTMEEKINSQTPTEPPAPQDPTPPAPEAPRTPPQTMEELDAYVQEQAKNIVESQKKAEEEAQTQAQQQQQEQQKQIDQYLDQQVDNLVKSGDLPQKAEGEKNPYHASLYAYAAHLNTDNLVAVGKAIKAEHDQGKVFDLKATRDVANNPTGAPIFRQVGRGQAGGQAPVGTSAASTGVSKGAPDYKTIHGARDLDELVARADELLPDGQ